jgi:hypothetical protein
LTERSIKPRFDVGSAELSSLQTCAAHQPCLLLEIK